MATAITRAFEHWQAQQILNNLPARPDTVIFAHIPGLDSNVEIDRDEGIPDEALIVYQTAVAQYGVINDSTVAYSVVLDTSVGDFYFNWIGLVDAASGTLCMIVHNALQHKIATAGGVQGNNITRTFTMEFDGAAEASQINVTAQTWQIDFSARLRGIDEVTRLANYDYYGHAAFFADGFSVSEEAGKYRIKSGLAYIGGIRALLADDMLLEAGVNNLIYADVSFQGSVLGEFNAIIHIGTKNDTDDLSNYPDPNGFIHFIAPLAIITAEGLEDKRDANPFDKAIADINAALTAHEKSRNHPDATLNAKGFTQLSSAVDSESETLAATSKAVNIAMDNANTRLAKDQNGADIPNMALFRQNIGVRGSALLDVGTTAGTVAAGNDSRIVNAVQSTNIAISLPGSLTTAGTLKGSAVTAAGNVASGNGAAFLQADGNVYGPVWNGYLSTYIGNQTNAHGVMALGRGAQVAMPSSSYNMMSPAGTFVNGVTVNGNGQTTSVYYRGLFMQRPTGGWAQMGGDIG